MWSFSPFQNRVVLFLSPQNPMVLPIYSRSSWPSPFYFRTTWPSSFPLRISWFSPHFKATWPHLGLNPSAHIPLQPHFRLLLQSATPASIPVFFQLYWAAIVSPGRCGPTAWSQSSPSSHAGSVTRGSCFPVPSWVEVTPIPWLKAWPQLFNISMKQVKGYRCVK